MPCVEKNVRFKSVLTNFVHLFNFLLQICLETSGNFSVWKVVTLEWLEIGGILLVLGERASL